MEEISKLHAKTIELAEALTTLQSTNNSLQFYSKKLEHKLKNLGNSFFPNEVQTKKCQVCCVLARDHVVLPCSHVFCQACSTRALRTRCHVCRNTVKEVIKLFL